jgi:hypothetical protein
MPEAPRMAVLKLSQTCWMAGFVPASHPHTELGDDPYDALRKLVWSARMGAQIVGALGRVPELMDHVDPPLLYRLGA